MMELTDDLRARLLRHARGAIIASLAGEEPAHPDSSWPDLPRCGAFVTLRKFGQLRGCIGVFETLDDVPTTIARMAMAAARDPRFIDTPLSVNELKDVRIEISLLSPLREVADPLDFELGRHGIYVKRGDRVGCFLPDVATDRGWDKETFLTQCCMQKAGLDPRAWKQPETEIHVFTVQKICESLP
jgi:AmmeMemoRadiSam system protein A